MLKTGFSTPRVALAIVLSTVSAVAIATPLTFEAIEARREAGIATDNIFNALEPLPSTTSSEEAASVEEPVSPGPTVAQHVIANGDSTSTTEASATVAEGSNSTAPKTTPSANAPTTTTPGPTTTSSTVIATSSTVIATSSTTEADSPTSSLRPKPTTTTTSIVAASSTTTDPDGSGVSPTVVPISPTTTQPASCPTTISTIISTTDLTSVTDLDDLLDLIQEVSPPIIPLPECSRLTTTTSVAGSRIIPEGVGGTTSTTAAPEVESLGTTTTVADKNSDDAADLSGHPLLVESSSVEESSAVESSATAAG